LGLRSLDGRGAFGLFAMTLGALMCSALLARDAWTRLKNPLRRR
jgi:hypothetical protein